MTLVTGSGPQQQVGMSALDLRRYISVLVASEGVAAANDLAVAQRAAGANMSVDIATGEAYLQGDQVTNQGFYWALNDATYNLTGFTAAHATLPRIDRVVLRENDAFHGSGDNIQSFAILTGTATSGATLTNTTGAVTPGNNELLLANVLLPAAATTITTANIDTTGASNNSPAVRPRLTVAQSPQAGSEVVAPVEQTSSVACPTTNAVEQTVVTLGTASLDGLTSVLFSVSVPYITTVATGGGPLHLYDNGVSVGLLYQPAATVDTQAGARWDRRLTPAAGAHVYSVRWVGNGNAGATLVAGSGGAGVVIPILARLIRA